MNFNSTTFACFSLVVASLYFLLQSRRSPTAQNLLLLGASYFFYASWDYQLLFLILLSTVLDYTCGLAIAGETPSRFAIRRNGLLLAFIGCVLCLPFDLTQIYEHLLPSTAFDGGWSEDHGDAIWIINENAWLTLWSAIGAVAAMTLLLEGGRLLLESRQRQYYLILSVCGNLGLLGFFKYYDFFISSLTDALGNLGIYTHEWQLGIVVPVGISFYTFQTLSYTIDIYRGQLQPTKNYVTFALFVAYFPQLVAGPIERARVLLPQLNQKRKIQWVGIRAGAFLIGWGLFKKIFIADNLAELVSPVFAENSNATAPQVLLATYAFAFQIYADFSAYSDIARGVSRCLGIELMVNFNVPFAAKSPSEFWQRWHISLSTWLRDYLYIPLGGNRGGKLTVYRNLMLTMLLGGLWHGARMNFIWWGLYHGLLLCLYRSCGPYISQLIRSTKLPQMLVRFISWFVFFHLTCYGWLLFRAESTEQILILSATLLSGWGETGHYLGFTARLIWFCWLLVLVQVFQFRSNNLLIPLTWPGHVRALFFTLAFYLTVIFGNYVDIEFIYFQF